MSPIIFWSGLAGIFSLVFFAVSALIYTILSAFFAEEIRPDFVASTVYGIPLQLVASWASAELVSRDFDMAFGGSGLVIITGLIVGVLPGVLIVLIAFITHRYAKS